jgi:hypothetical protein
MLAVAAHTLCGYERPRAWVRGEKCSLASHALCGMRAAFKREGPLAARVGAWLMSTQDSAASGRSGRLPDAGPPTWSACLHDRCRTCALCSGRSAPRSLVTLSGHADT